jgi:hypothetical protein
MSVSHGMRRAEGTVIWTIEVTGGYDIYRFATALLSAQVEFGEVGRRALARLRRHVGPSTYRGLQRYLHCRSPEEQEEYEQLLAAAELDAVGVKARDVVATALEHEGPAWWADDTGDHLARVAVEALHHARLLRSAVSEVPHV